MSKTLSVNTATERLTAANRTLTKVGREHTDATKKLVEVQDVLTNPAADPLVRRRAYLDAPDVERQAFATETEWLDAMRQIELARDDQREALIAEAIPALRDAVRAFAAALDAAATANATIQRLQFALHEKTGRPFDPLSWAEFSLRSEHWREHARAAGLLDDSKVTTH